MKRLSVVACVTLLALIAAGSVRADDEYTGAYLGANAGGTFGRSHANTTTVFSPSGYFATTSPGAIATVGAQSLTLNGFNGGGQFGLNIQVHHFLFGFEADYGAMKLSSSATGTATYPCCSPTTFTVSQTVSTNWLVTVRPRIGVVWHHALIYVTGGIALTSINYSELFTDTFASANESASASAGNVGWTAGGGMEYHLWKHFSIKAEYLYADFGSVRTTSTNLSTVGGGGGSDSLAAAGNVFWPQNPFTHSASLRAHVVRGGLNWHF